MEDFYKNYKPDFAIHPKFEKALSTLNACNQEVFSELRTDFDDRKKACDIYEYKEKKLLEDNDHAKAARVADLQELIILCKDSRKTKEHLGTYKKKYEDLAAAFKALEKSSKKMKEKLRRKTGSVQRS